MEVFRKSGPVFGLPILLEVLKTRSSRCIADSQKLAAARYTGGVAREPTFLQVSHFGLSLDVAAISPPSLTRAYQSTFLDTRLKEAATRSGIGRYADRARMNQSSRLHSSNGPRRATKLPSPVRAMSSPAPQGRSV
jgi:hypothetical protein